MLQSAIFEATTVNSNDYEIHTKAFQFFIRQIVIHFGPVLFCSLKSSKSCSKMTQNVPEIAKSSFSAESFKPFVYNGNTPAKFIHDVWDYGNWAGDWWVNCDVTGVIRLVDENVSRSTWSSEARLAKRT